MKIKTGIFCGIGKYKNTFLTTENRLGVIAKRFSCILILILAAGCGYKTGSLLPTHLKSIYVDNFVNKIDISRESSYRRGYEIYRSGMESDITTTVIDQFIFDGNLAIVEAEEADLVLEGVLTNYAKEPLRYDKFDNVEEYRVFVSVDIELKEAAGDRTIWYERGFTGESTYRTSGTLAESEASSRTDAVKDLAKRIVEKTTEGW